jgi:hypothetical protein
LFELEPVYSVNFTVCVFAGLALGAFAHACGGVTDEMSGLLPERKNTLSLAAAKWVDG